MRRDAPFMCHGELRAVRREEVRHALGSRQDQATLEKKEKEEKEAFRCIHEYDSVRRWRGPGGQKRAEVNDFSVIFKCSCCCDFSPLLPSLGVETKQARKATSVLQEANSGARSQLPVFMGFVAGCSVSAIEQTITQLLVRTGAFCGWRDLWKHWSFSLHASLCCTGVLTTESHL